MLSESELFQFELDAKRDDLFQIIVPSDVRRMLKDIREYRRALERVREALSLYANPDLFIDSLYPRAYINAYKALGIIDDTLETDAPNPQKAD